MGIGNHVRYWDLYLIDDWDCPPFPYQLPQQTPLSRAAGNKEVVELLLKSGAQPDLQDPEGHMPLSRATLNRNTDVQLLNRYLSSSVILRQQRWDSENGSYFLWCLGSRYKRYYQISFISAWYDHWSVCCVMEITFPLQCFWVAGIPEDRISFFFFFLKLILRGYHLRLFCQYISFVLSPGPWQGIMCVCVWCSSFLIVKEPSIYYGSIQISLNSLTGCNSKGGQCQPSI